MSNNSQTSSIGGKALTFDTPMVNRPIVAHDVFTPSNSFSDQWSIVNNADGRMDLPSHNATQTSDRRQVSTDTSDSRRGSTETSDLREASKWNSTQKHCISPRTRQFHSAACRKYTLESNTGAVGGLNLTVDDFSHGLTDSWIGVTKENDSAMCTTSKEPYELENTSKWPDSKSRSLPPLEHTSRDPEQKRSRSSSLSKDDSDLDSNKDDQNDKLTNSVKSMWNNFKYGFTWNMKTEFKYDSALWLLGRFYHCSRQERDEQKKAHNAGCHFLTSMDEFRIDFGSRLWFTYRKDFNVLPQSSLTSDVGWGCMLRTGQMMIGQALVLHSLGNDWRYQTQTKEQRDIYRNIIQCFCDIYSIECPFSIHKLVELGIAIGKMPGDWYGPASAAHVFSKAISEAQFYHPMLSDLCIYVAQDCTVYLQDVTELCQVSCKSVSQPSGNEQPLEGATAQATTSNKACANSTWRACVILIPVRLGGVELNDLYVPCLKNLLAYPTCLGIIGGKPKHSLYFVGWQEEKAIYLDPHYCQEAIDIRRKNTSCESFHCQTPRKMNFSKLDPSCTIGFYCRTESDFYRFVIDAKKMALPLSFDKHPYPMFVFQDGKALTGANDTVQGVREPDKVLKISYIDKQGRSKPIKDSDDFVFLE